MTLKHFFFFNISPKLCMMSDLFSLKLPSGSHDLPSNPGRPQREWEEVNRLQDYPGPSDFYYIRRGLQYRVF